MPRHISIANILDTIEVKGSLQDALLDGYIDPEQVIDPKLRELLGRIKTDLEAVDKILDDFDDGGE